MRNGAGSPSCSPVPATFGGSRPRATRRRSAGATRDSPSGSSTSLTSRRSQRVPDVRVNGQAHRLDPPGLRSLAEILREDLGLTGTKIGCGEGHCGACTVLLDGEPVLSCITLAEAVGEREVTTIEGLRNHPLVDSFVRADALQCGFCTPGQIVSASALVADSPEPTRDAIRHAMAGNICRCGAYPKIEEAILTWQD